MVKRHYNFNEFFICILAFMVNFNIYFRLKNKIRNNN